MMHDEDKPRKSTHLDLERKSVEKRQRNSTFLNKYKQQRTPKQPTQGVDDAAIFANENEEEYDDEGGEIPEQSADKQEPEEARSNLSEDKHNEEQVAYHVQSCSIAIKGHPVDFLQNANDFPESRFVTNKDPLAFSMGGNNSV